MTWKKHGFLLVLMLFSFALADRAEACKDCAFPKRIGKDQWQMPNSNVVIRINEVQLADKNYIMAVELRDVVTQEALAYGTAHRLKGQRLVNLVLFDPEGRRVKADIMWVSFHQSVIRAKFSCELDGECSLTGKID